MTLRKNHREEIQEQSRIGTKFYSRRRRETTQLDIRPTKRHMRLAYRQRQALTSSNPLQYVTSTLAKSCRSSHVPADLTSPKNSLSPEPRALSRVRRTDLLREDIDLAAVVGLSHHWSRREQPPRYLARNSLPVVATTCEISLRNVAPLKEVTGVRETAASLCKKSRNVWDLVIVASGQSERKPPFGVSKRSNQCGTEFSDYTEKG